MLAWRAPVKSAGAGILAVEELENAAPQLDFI